MSLIVAGVRFVKNVAFLAVTWLLLPSFARRIRCKNLGKCTFHGKPKNYSYNYTNYYDTTNRIACGEDKNKLYTANTIKGIYLQVQK